jgi:hypothetical protein
MATVKLNKEEIDMVLKGLANIITIKHRYREVKMPNIDTDVIRAALHKLENPFIKEENKILRASEDSTDSFEPRIGNCECCDD